MEPTSPHGRLTRRQVLGWAGAGVVASAAAAQAWPDGQEPLDRAAATAQRTPSPRRQPVVYLPHGGGPWPFVAMGLDVAEVDALRAYLHALVRSMAVRPSALLVVSAHWEAAKPTVMTHPQPPLLFDYHGFPPDSYRLTWPAAGAPQLAAEVQQLLRAAGLASDTDAARGFDHGTFVPLKVAVPAADLPVLQLSLMTGLDPAAHLALGRALQPLRERGVLIIGSGMSFHNMRAFGRPESVPRALAFDRWLQAAATALPDQRDAQLRAWTQAPEARWVHPREEHLLPLMVVAGAAGDDQGATAFSGTFMGMPISAFQYG